MLFTTIACFQCSSLIAFLKLTSFFSSYAFDYRQMVCRQVRTLSKGWHTINFNLYAYGRVYLYGGSGRSYVHVRQVGTVNAVAPAEDKSECKGRTVHRLLQTYQANSLSPSGCSSRYTMLGGLFATKGPWSLKSATGRVRVYFKNYVYSRTSSCSSTTSLQYQAVVDGSAISRSTYHYNRAWLACDKSWGSTKKEVARVLSVNHLAISLFLLLV